MDSTLALIQKAHQGDKKARDTIFQENVGKFIKQTFLPI